MRRHPSSTLFPYTTLFRSVEMGGGLRQLGLQRGSDLGVLGADRCRVGLLEDGPDQGGHPGLGRLRDLGEDRKSTRLNSSHMSISYAVFCLKKKKNYK